MFADETILFNRANEKEARAFIECLKKYEEWSGQKVSYHKSRIVFFPKLQHSTRNKIGTILGMKEAHHSKKYLGNPLFVTKKKKRHFDFQFIKEKVLQRLEG